MSDDEFFDDDPKREPGPMTAAIKAANRAAEEARAEGPPEGDRVDHSGQWQALFARLARPFAPQEVKSRSQGGRQLYYVTARTVMNRFDEVLGPENWWDEYYPNANSVVCRLTIRLPDGQILTKADAGGYAGMADHGDDDKSGYSDAFKRAGVKFGAGRYLYRDGVPAFVREAALAEERQEGPQRPREEAPRQQPAKPPANGNGRHQGPQEPRQEAPRNGNGRAGGNGSGEAVPRTGRALFAWLKEMEQKHEVALIKYINNWAKLQEFPARMVDWDAERAAQGHAEACRKLRSLAPPRDDD